jgi:hypothetical protein
MCRELNEVRPIVIVSSLPFAAGLLELEPAACWLAPVLDCCVAAELLDCVAVLFELEEDPPPLLHAAAAMSKMPKMAAFLCHAHLRPAMRLTISLLV